ncbi:Spo0E family sporulation regulatory protein-aspartic acid phosphatase [Priestia aryabhattai]|uniref:Spo0E family sporulation regulatory protein-aspartic acid phosphatase n=1 Tax=Priestia aryabhattai TaxID=412384 RepID=UPI001C0C1AE0|nr:Spo0E family sporulation regulatory protein-aspartic acid phosphatase [Priestia aryabhattai]MBU3568856.1 Spo0E family sporulation regulatory protein-aspartic acid phosphatase [Priestia aryabhattai]
MKLSQLEEEIIALQKIIYSLAKDNLEYCDGDILKISQELDKKIFIYQKMINSID